MNQEKMSEAREQRAVTIDRSKCEVCQRGVGDQVGMHFGVRTLCTTCRDNILRGGN